MNKYKNKSEKEYLTTAMDFKFYKKILSINLH